MTNRVPQLGIWDTGVDPAKAGPALTEQYNQMFTDLKQQMRKVRAATDITGSRADTDAALANLLTALAAAGIITDSTTA